MNSIIANIKNKINNDIHLKELLKGSSIAFVLRIIGIIAGYIFTLLITRGYGAEAMGVFALSFTLLQISSIIGRLGMDTALLRFVAEYSSQGKWEVVKDVYKKAIKLVIPFSIFLSVLVFFISPYIAEYIFKKPHLAPYFKIASIGILPFVLLFIHTESLRGLKKIKEYMFFQQAGIFILASIVLGILTLIIPHFQINTNLNQLPIFTYIFSVFVMSVTAYFVWNTYLKRGTISFDREKPESTTLTYPYILSVSIPMLFSSSLALIMGWTDTIMLGIFRTEEEVGIYNVALRVSMVTSITLMAINTIAAPKFAEFYMNIEKLKKIVYQSTKISFWSAIVVTGIVLLFHKSLLSIFGNEFLKGSSALIILSIGFLISSFSGSVKLILDMTGKQKLYTYLMLSCILLNILLNYLLIPSIGILGAATASSISLIYINLLANVFVKKFYGFYAFYIPSIFHKS